MSTSRFLGRYFSRQAGWMVIAVVASLTYAGASVGMVSLISPIFGEVLLADQQATPSLPGMGAVTGTGGASEGLPEGLSKVDLAGQLHRMYRELKDEFHIDQQNVVYFVPILFVIIFFFRSVAEVVNGYAFQRIGLGATTDIRNALYGRILDQSSRFYTEHPSGELVSRVVNDVSVMQMALSQRLLDLPTQSLLLLSLLWFLLSTHLWLSLACLVAAPLMIYPIVRFGAGMRRTSHRSQERMADLAALVNEGVRGHRVVKAFGMERFEYRRFWEASRRHLIVNLRAQMLAAVSGPVVQSISVVMGGLLLVYAGRTIRAGELSPPDFISFLMTLFMTYEPIRKLNKVNLTLQQSLAAVHRVRDLMVLPQDVEEAPNARELEEIRESICYEGVSFAYESEPVLRGIDLEIRMGEIVAIVGPSGAGKTSLVNLIPRFFDPNEGRVLIDGVDLREVTLASLRRQLGLVTQEVILFNDTVRGNIAYGQGELPLDRVREAAAAAYADEFIEQLPEGYETVVGESGLRLSGGQRQRLAIARALLKDPPILILDEATSQLDSESEALVQKALGNLMRGRTTLVIAHRLSTVTNADRIIVMEEGRIVEEGNHQELLARGGVYKRLHDLQFQT